MSGNLHTSGSTLSTELVELSANTTYDLLLQASTTVGVGDATDILRINTGSTAAPPKGDNGTAGISFLGGLIKNERDMGIFAGVLIGGCCIIVCAIIIILRNR